MLSICINARVNEADSLAKIGNDLQAWCRSTAETPRERHHIIECVDRQIVALDYSEPAGVNAATLRSVLN
jgi:hypothetical protein